MRRLFVPIILLLSLLSSGTTLGQEVTMSINRDSILIGEQIVVEITAKADPEALVIFPEGQVFYPLEVVSESAVDTLSKRPELEVLKTYKITQFDAGDYTLAAQQITIDRTPYTTQSIPIRINDVVVDTTKQGLYDTKSLLPKTANQHFFSPYLLAALLLLIIGGIFFFIKKFRNRTLAQNPYQTALREIDVLIGVQNQPSDEIYLSATTILKTYLNKRLSIASLQRTSKELLLLLDALGANEAYFKLSEINSKALEILLLQADQYKFAKVTPSDQQQATDLAFIREIIERYEEGYTRKTEDLKPSRKTSKKNAIIIAGVFFLFVAAALAGYGYSIGYQNLWDTLSQNPYKKEVEKNWVRSSYGFPPIEIETPEALIRKDSLFVYELKDKVTKVQLRVHQSDTTEEIDFVQIAEQTLAAFETQGYTTILPKSEIYTTKSDITGYHSFGTALDSQKNEIHFDHLIFGGNGFTQEVLIIFRQEDRWASAMADRILQSVSVNTEL